MKGLLEIPELLKLTAGEVIRGGGDIKGNGPKDSGQTISSKVYYGSPGSEEVGGRKGNS